MKCVCVTVVCPFLVRVVLQQGDVSRYLYLLVQGVVDVVRISETREEDVIGHIEEGSHFGELSILTEEPTTEAIRAQNFCSMLLVSRQDFDVMLVRDACVFAVLFFG